MDMFENEACHVLFVTFVAWNFSQLSYLSFSVCMKKQSADLSELLDRGWRSKDEIKPLHLRLDFNHNHLVSYSLTGHGDLVNIS